MYFILIIKTIILYFFIMIVYRIMGKKEVGQLSIVDLIVTILIAELAAMSIEESSSSIFISIVPIIVLVIIQILLSFISLKNKNVRDFIDGKPSIIIKNGKIIFSTMTQLRYSLDDLILQLREKQVSSIEDVKYAILENNGKLSVFDKTSSYPMPIILDGVIDKNVLNDINKTVKWVYQILKEKNIKLEDVFYAFYAKGNTFIIKRKDLE
ncbi:MAG: DUF421 domain-containing protein [Bacilli bacterium]